MLKNVSLLLEMGNPRKKISHCNKDYYYPKVDKSDYKISLRLEVYFIRKLKIKNVFVFGKLLTLPKFLCYSRKGCLVNTF